MIIRRKTILVIASLTVFFSALLFFPTTTDTSRPEAPATQVNTPPHNIIVEMQSLPAPPEKKHSDHPPLKLSPEMNRAINSFVGKGMGELKRETLKDGGSIAKLEGRYRHVTVVTINALGGKTLQEFGPHGVKEEK